MKTTARTVAGLLAATCCLWATFGRGQYQADHGPVSAPRSSSAAGASVEANRRQMDDLLARARQAISENQLDVAERLVAQAESLGVGQSPLNPLADSPAKVRRELDRRRAAAGATAVTPSRLFGASPFARQGEAPAADPFARQVSTPAASPAGSLAGSMAAPVTSPMGVAEASDAMGVVPLPPVGASSADAAGYATAASTQPASPPVDPAARTACDQLLLSARRALAMGDARRASDLVQRAKAFGVSYGPRDDSPYLVESAIAKYQGLVAEQAQRRHTEAYRRQFARVMMEQAEALLNWGDVDEAERLANQARAQGLNYGPLDVSPDMLLARITGARQGNVARGAAASAVVPASATYVTPATGSSEMDRRASPAVYDAGRDPTRTVQATNLTPPPPPRPLEFAQNAPTLAPTPPRPAAGGMPMVTGNSAETLFQQGEAALKARNIDQALEFYRQAAQYGDQLDPVMRQRLQDRLQLLTSPAPTPVPAGEPSLAADAAAAQQLLARQVNADVAHQERRAAELRESDPKAALAILEQTRGRVEAAGLEPAARTAILRRVDRSIAEMRQFLEDNRGRIELAERNQETREDIQREQKHTAEVQEKLAKLVDEFNRLIDEQRFEEAEVVAKQARELAPNNPVAGQLVHQAKFIRRVMNNNALVEAKERGFVDAMASVDWASRAFDDRKPYQLPDPKTWEQITTSRAKLMAEEKRSRRTEREIEIEQKLKTPVSLQFQNAPLASVLDHLGQLAGVNVHLDPRGMAEEGVVPDTPVTINLRQDVALRSALDLILQPLHLGYVIEDEVLKITSEQHRAGAVYQKVYHVADLVIPIPNFKPNSRMGLSGAYNDAMERVGYGAGPYGGGVPPLGVVAANNLPENAKINDAVLAQIAHQSPGAASALGGETPTGFGPGGLGGGANADFDTLIELITTTIRPETWADVQGGLGQIHEFPTNLSLVITQTEEVHEEIVDLLEQLRRMQDLQVTIEVRFITLNDNFFERIGVDFDFDINDNIDRPYQVFGRVIEGDDDTGTGTGTNGTGTNGTTSTEPRRNTNDVDNDRSVTVGMSAPGIFAADLDIPFTQNSFGLAVPQFGGFDATAGASLGFAILSDIEAFFFINAAQADRRTNVLQAPKVTLFDGQMAFVTDSSQRPFVVGLNPVVGDFAAAQQPVVVILSEGTFLTVQAVVSADRRFVRLTVVPVFSQIGDINTFTFTGTTTTTQDTSTEGNQTAPNDNSKKKNIRSTTVEGSTVQQPTITNITVSTTVSVPDGGTVLLGGIKRLSEGRTEAGTPILNKIPYVSRLFKNVGIGRETQSLMMMVTPRIIIQREEEERIGAGPTTD